MYQHLTKNVFLKRAKITISQVPDTIIIYGGYNRRKFSDEWISQWKDYLKIPWFFGIEIGEYHRKRVGFAIAYGPSMVGEIVHIFCVLGTKQIILVGSFGGLQSDIKFGDILIPTSASREDGVSDLYIDKKIGVKPNTQLIKNVAKKLKNVKIHFGKIVTTCVMSAETQQQIKEWHKKGYIGVDLETATVFAVAQHFNAKAISILTMADNLYAGETVFDRDRSQKEKRDATLNYILQIVSNF